MMCAEIVRNSATTNLPTWLPFITAALGALVGGIVSLAVNIIKGRIDGYAARCEEQCKSIQSSADLASEYWLMSVSSDKSNCVDEKHIELRLKSLLFEARIQGFLDHITYMDENLRKDLPRKERDKILLHLPKFIDALTGGDFSARNGNPDITRARLVQSIAANFVADIRLGIMNRNSLLFFITHRMKIN